VNVSGLAVVVAVLAVWEVAVASGALRYAYLPAPHQILSAGAELLAGGQLVTDVIHTVGVTLVAWLLALVAGTVAGVLMGLWRPARTLFATSVDVLRTLPVVAFVPVAVLLFGLSTTMEVAVAAWAAVWPILVNARGAVDAVHPRLHEVAATLRLGAVRTLRAVVLPAAAPFVLVGARLGLSFALIVTVVAEMIGNPTGLGYEIVQAQQSLRPEAMFAYILVVGLIGNGLDIGLNLVASGAFPGMVNAEDGRA
jgi:ABC-type nitrate/sulfonate/bicarbonate transport system permease component